jgi:hypothetical protein
MTFGAGLRIRTALDLDLVSGSSALMHAMPVVGLGNEVWIRKGEEGGREGGGRGDVNMTFGAGLRIRTALDLIQDASALMHVCVVTK